MARLCRQDSARFGSHLPFERLNLAEARAKASSVVVGMVRTDPVRRPLIEERGPLAEHGWFSLSFTPGADNQHEARSTVHMSLRRLDRQSDQSMNPANSGPTLMIAQVHKITDGTSFAALYSTLHVSNWITDVYLRGGS